MDFHIGDEVWWEDPNDGVCSGHYRVSDIDGYLLTLENDTGYFAKVFTSQCKLINELDLKEYTVDVHFDIVKQYKVLAHTEKDAKNKVLAIINKGRKDN